MITRTYTSKVQVAARRKFVCPSCGYSTEVLVRAEGSGQMDSTIRGTVQAQAKSESLAHEDAEQEIEMLLAVFPCPECQHHSPAWRVLLRAEWVSILFATVLLGGIGFVPGFLGADYVSTGPRSLVFLVGSGAVTGGGLVLAFLVSAYRERLVRLSRAAELVGPE